MTSLSRLADAEIAAKFIAFLAHRGWEAVVTDEALTLGAEGLVFEVV